MCLEMLEKVTVDQPLWYDPSSPLGSAVRYIAALSPRFHWVGIYVLKGKFLVLGPYLGEHSERTRIPIGKGVCGTAVAENADQNVPNVRERAKIRSELVALIRSPKGKILGQFDIGSHVSDAFGLEEEKAVRKVADELGERWPV